MLSMRHALVAALSVATLAGNVSTASAAECNAKSPRNFAGTCESDGNQLQCNSGSPNTPVGFVYVSPDGAELCSSGRGLPIEGRAGVDLTACKCVYVDGTDTNPRSPTETRGWIRIDSNGVRCNDNGERQLSYNSPDGRGRGCTGFGF